MNSNKKPVYTGFLFERRKFKKENLIILYKKPVCFGGVLVLIKAPANYEEK